MADRKNKLGLSVAIGAGVGAALGVVRVRVAPCIPQMMPGTKVTHDSNDKLTTRLRNPTAQGIAAEMSPNEPFFELYRRKAFTAARRSLAIVSALVG
jgi:hypothetical protein